ncbi:MAG: biotin transporter BioY [Candidatus Aenigmatarchaeota archaeon]
MKVLSFSERNVLVKKIEFILFFTLLMIISSYLRIPLFFTPVPLTLQTLVLFLSLIFLKNKAFFSQLLYIFLGIIGLPVFGKAGAGLFYIFGPTAGYLFGFLFVALVFPRFLKYNNSNFFKYFLFFSFANLIIYSFGILWLINFYKVNFITSLFLGVFPFLIGDFIKILFASFLVEKFFKKYLC